MKKLVFCMLALIAPWFFHVTLDQQVVATLVSEYQKYVPAAVLPDQNRVVGAEAAAQQFVRIQ